MDDLYRARLTHSPPVVRRPLLDDQRPIVQQKMPDTPPRDHPDPTFHILPHPNPPQNGNQPRPPGPVPIHLPNMYLNPYPPAAPVLPPPMPSQPSVLPANIPTARDLPSPGIGRVQLGSLKLKKAHPLLWLSLLISIIALVLGVPKGSLPTLTGRHKELRAQERLLDQKLHLLTQLSNFLPPPLQPLVQPPNPIKPSPLDYLSLYSPLHPLSFVKHNLNHDHTTYDEDLLRLTSGTRFWSTTWGRGEGDFEGQGSWWSIDELGRGASVVRSRGEGEEKEVWVIRIGEGSSETQPLQTALTHSLLLRDKLQRELSAIRANPCPVAQQEPTPSTIPTQLYITGPSREREDDKELEEEWDRRRGREREREKEVEEREREVARREQWVVDEMRKISDKVHSQATELTLEDRITERLKAYQRQLAHLHGDTSDDATK